MAATAVSRTVRIKGIKISVRERVDLRANIALPKSVIKRCPAIMLAVSRTHRVMGRIRFLVSSMRTINLIRAMGVPWGTRCASMWFVLLIQPKRLIESQLSMASGRVRVRWEVREKTCGNKAVAFISRMAVNKERM